MKRVFVTASVLVAIATTASAEFIVNGGFSLDASGWTANNIDGSGGWRDTGGNPDVGGTFILNNGGPTTPTPSIQQSITGLTIGQAYRISGDEMRANSSDGGNTDFGVEIDGHLWEYNIPTTSWFHFSEVFVALNTTATLLLTGERHADNDPKIDNISLTPVPEPTTTLLALGAVLSALRKRRK